MSNPCRDILDMLPLLRFWFCFQKNNFSIHLIGHSSLNPTFFWTKSYFSLKLFWPRFFGPNIFLDPNFFLPDIFLDPTFFGPIIFLNPTFFGPKFLLYPKCFGPKNIVGPKLFSTQNIFGPKICLDPKFCWTHIFWTQNSLDHKETCSYSKISFSMSLSVLSFLLSVISFLPSTAAWTSSSTPSAMVRRFSASSSPCVGGE